MQERKIDTWQPQRVASGAAKTAPSKEAEQSTGRISTFRGLDDLAQWSLPPDFAIWQKFGPHIIEVLTELPDGQPELPPADKRGYFVIVVREGFEQEDREAALSAFDADPYYGNTFIPFRWLRQWVRLAAVTRAEGILEMVI